MASVASISGDVGAHRVHSRTYDEAPVGKPCQALCAAVLSAAQALHTITNGDMPINYDKLSHNMDSLLEVTKQLANHIKASRPDSPSLAMPFLSEEVKAECKAVQAEVTNKLDHNAPPQAQEMWEKCVRKGVELEVKKDPDHFNVDNPKVLDAVLSKAIDLFAEHLNEPIAEQTTREFKAFKKSFLNNLIPAQFSHSRFINNLAIQARSNSFSDFTAACASFDSIGQVDGAISPSLANVVKDNINFIADKLLVDGLKLVAYRGDVHLLTYENFHSEVSKDLYNSIISPDFLISSKTSLDNIAQSFSDKMPGVIDTDEFRTHLTNNFLDLVVAHDEHANGDWDEYDYGRALNSFTEKSLKQYLNTAASTNKTVEDHRKVAVENFVKNLSKSGKLQDGQLRAEVKQEFSAQVKGFRSSLMNDDALKRFVTTLPSSMSQRSRKANLQSVMNVVGQTIISSDGQEAVSTNTKKTTKRLASSDDNAVRRKFQAFADKLISNLTDGSAAKEDFLDKSQTYLFDAALTASGVDAKSFNQFLAASYGEEGVIIESNRNTFETKAERFNDRGSIKKFFTKLSAVTNGSKGMSLKSLRNVQNVLANKLFFKATAADAAPYVALIDNSKNAADLARVGLLIASALGDTLMSSTDGLNLIEFCLKLEHKNISGLSNQDKNELKRLVGAMGEPELTRLGGKWQLVADVSATGTQPSQTNIPSSVKKPLLGKVYSRREVALAKREAEKNGTSSPVLKDFGLKHYLSPSSHKRMKEVNAVEQEAANQKHQDIADAIDEFNTVKSNGNVTDGESYRTLYRNYKDAHNAYYAESELYKLNNSDVDRDGNYQLGSINLLREQARSAGIAYYDALGDPVSSATDLERLCDDKTSAENAYTDAMKSLEFYQSMVSNSTLITDLGNAFRTSVDALNTRSAALSRAAERVNSLEGHLSEMQLRGIIFTPVTEKLQSALIE